MQLQKEINVDLSGKSIVIASDDYIPYPYIKSFIPYISESRITLLQEPVKYYKYTKILLNSFDIKHINFLKFKKIEESYDKSIYILFFGKKNNKDKEFLLTLSRMLLLDNQEVIALSENGVDIDEDSSIYRS